MSYVTDSFDEKVVSLLKDGGVGLLPSDTIYGLSCRALDQNAVEKVHSLKDRDTKKPFIVLISDVKMLDLLSISKEQALITAPYWPGPLSAILEAPGSPNWLHRSTKTLAVRIPNSDNLRSLINKTGPIISTSANHQGRPPISSANEAIRIFGDKLDFYVDVGELNNLPSTLAAVKDGQLIVERQGAVKIG